MSKPLLVAENLHRSFRMGRVTVDVLTGCAMTLQAGEFVTVMGRSGSGKSTLLHLLGALDAPQAGQVFFRGDALFPGLPANVAKHAPRPRRNGGSSLTRVFDVFSTNERRRISLRRSAFGFVFQFYHLLPELNVLENAVLPRMISVSTFDWFASRVERRDEAKLMLERCGLGHRLKHRPNELSGGERQRVAIARALIHKPDILFADEPTGNLDADAGRSIMELLLGLHREGQTIVMVTHDPGMAEFSDRLLRLEDGQLREV